MPSVTTRVREAIDRIPKPAVVIVGVVALAAGATVLLRPSTSLGVLAFVIGLAMLVGAAAELADDRRPFGWRLLATAGWTIGGLLVLVLPGLTVRLLTAAVGVALLVSAVATLAAIPRGRTTLDRVATAVFGAAGLVFGGLALAWPDITLLVATIVLGARLILFGVTTIWHAVSGRRAEPRRTPPPARLAGAVVTFAVAVACVGIAGAVQAGSPVVDEFYAAPRDVPDEPGALIRAESFTRDVPAGSVGWRILYTTTRGDGSAALASGIVVSPTDGADHPVIAWAHGTTGVAQQCAPSLLPHPFEAGALFATGDVLDQGWSLVATDYIGLGTAGPHPYLIGEDSAHAVLDAVRAARQLADARVGAETVVWGHSQGGGAALWTAAVAADYAPDVPLAGTAALAPASDLLGLVEGLDDVPGGSVFASFVIAAYASVHPDVTYREYVRPGAEVQVREFASRCLAEPGTFVSLLTLLALSGDPEIIATDPGTGPLGARLAENTPPPPTGVPLFVGQGQADELIPLSLQDGYVATLCAAGATVVYRPYADLGHMTLVTPPTDALPDVIAWTSARFAREPAPTACAPAD